jgi:hypothetical protein
LPIQEDIDNRTVALSVKASKLTARALAAILSAAARQIKKARDKAQTPQGRQSVKKLMNHRAAVNTIPLDGDTRLFDKVARKWNVDYSFHKTGPQKYLLLFKSGQADAITAAFSEYSKLVVARAKDKRVPLREQLERFTERTRERSRERERTREVSHDER